MKISVKSTYLLIVSAITFVSCSQDNLPDVPEGEGNRIIFRTSLPEHTTRTEILTKDNLPYFYVTAFDFDDPGLVSGGVMHPLFSKEKIELVSGKNSFTSPNCCWPEDVTKENDKVSFFGLYPGPDKLEGAQLWNASTSNTLNYKLTKFRVISDISEQTDLVTAYATGSMADNLFSGITLPFEHQLSRIEVKAYGLHKSCDIEIAGIRIGGIGVEDTFDFKPMEGGGQWSGSPTPGIVEYIFTEGNKIVVCGSTHPVKEDNAMSIMGIKRSKDKDKAYDNSAMIIPAKYGKWNYAEDRHNEENQMYISVLLRVIDATHTAGINPVEKQRYPYTDLSQGDDAFNIPVEYLAVEKTSGIISKRLYKKGDSYFTDPEFTNEYNNQSSDVEIKQFGWAAVPVEGDLKPGKIYTYVLNYTHGVGLHNPEVTTTAPGAGDPVISDRVGITCTVKDWNEGGGSQFTAPSF